MGTAFGHLEEPPPPLERVPGPFAEAVLVALVKDPADRPPTAREYGQTLLQALGASG